MTSWPDPLPSGNQKRFWRDPSYGKHFIIRAEEMLTAFVELQRAIHEFAVSLIT
jgi:hypothetical protein